ncbi:hypothetical protein AHiyo1_44300 [Arthrobacter sp. Hiyo1]|nr:hypothetical protein AHiyo1_44300 [Arthrobacter sp. Hiyo1]
MGALRISLSARTSDGHHVGCGNFYAAAEKGALPAVSWIDPAGAVREHPGAHKHHAGLLHVFGANEGIPQPSWSARQDMSAQDSGAGQAITGRGGSDRGNDSPFPERLTRGNGPPNHVVPCCSPRSAAFLAVFPCAALVFVEGAPAGDGGPEGGQDPPPGAGGQSEGEEKKDSDR